MEETSGKAVLIKKGQVIPENAEPISDSDILQIQESRIQRFKPQSEMRIFTWGSGSAGAVVAVSSLIINNIVRQNFKLGGLRRAATYLPVAVVPTIASLLINDLIIKRSILLGRENCPTCVSLRSGVYQVACGVVYPYMISILACTPVARDYYTLPLPIQKGSGLASYLRILRQVSPSSSITLALVLGNMFAGMRLASSEMKVFHKHLRHPPTKDDLPASLKYGK